MRAECLRRIDERLNPKAGEHVSFTESFAGRTSCRTSCRCGCCALRVPPHCCPPVAPATGAISSALELEPGPARTPKGRVVLTADRAEIGPPDARAVLEPGDCFSFAGDEPHRYGALHPGARAVLGMEHP